MFPNAFTRPQHADKKHINPQYVSQHVFKQSSAVLTVQNGRHRSHCPV